MKYQHKTPSANVMYRQNITDVDSRTGYYKVNYNPFMSDVYKVDNVSVKETHPLAGSVSLYPNPAKDVVYIRSLV